MNITTNDQYKHIVYALRSYRLMIRSGQSACYLAKYHELTALLYDARQNGLFIVTSLALPSVVSIEVENTETCIIWPMVA